MFVAEGSSELDASEVPAASTAEGIPSQPAATSHQPIMQQASEGGFTAEASPSSEADIGPSRPSKHDVAHAEPDWPAIPTPESDLADSAQAVPAQGTLLMPTPCCKLWCCWLDL